MSRSVRTSPLVITILLVVAGCGGDDDTSSESSTPDATTAPAVATSTSAPSRTSPVQDPPTTPPRPTDTAATDPSAAPGSVAATNPGAAPAEMCPAGAWPMVAAYDIESGAVSWAQCEPGGGLFLMAAASQDTLWVTAPAEQRFVAFDAATGAELWRGDQARFDSEVPDDADVPVSAPPPIDGVQLSGGQEGPISGINETTGEMWVQPGQLVYDDVWAVGDGAVFAVDQPALVAYEVASGELRWRRDLPAYLWPWHVTGERLLVMWFNLQLAATSDGEVLWETTYPEPGGFPRMMGGLANDDSVFVAFTSETSGGD